MDIGVPELLIILFIVILIFGPGRLVKLGRELGAGISQFRQGIQPSQPPEETPAPEHVEQKIP